MADQFPYFITFEITHADGRKELGNDEYSIEAGIENIGDVRDIEAYYERQGDDGRTVLLLSYRPILGAGEFTSAQETVTTERVTVIEEDGPVWGSRY
jgi:hypothetical protein